MKLEKFDSTNGTGRVPLVRGDSTNGETFVVSILSDGTGIVMEFEDEEAYLLKIDELILELLRGREDAKRLAT